MLVLFLYDLPVYCQTDFLPFSKTKKRMMIARIWHGTTKIEDYEAYTDFMKTKAIPDYEGTDGLKKLTFLRRTQDNIAHFTLITFWESLEVIKNFAGEDFEKAKYYPEDQQYLLVFEEKVLHYEVFAE